MVTMVTLEWFHGNWTLAMVTIRGVSFVCAFTL